MSLSPELTFSKMIRKMKDNAHILMDAQQTIRAVGIDFEKTSKYAFMNFEEFCTVTNQVARMAKGNALRPKYIKKASRSFSKHVKNLKIVTDRSV